MDGPIENWNFYFDQFQESRSAKLTDLVNLVSFDLHLVHVSFQKGAKDSWMESLHIIPCCVAAF